MVTQITASRWDTIPQSRYILRNTWAGDRSFLCCDYVQKALGECPNTITFSVSDEEVKGWETLFTDSNRGIFDEKKEEVNTYGAMVDFIFENIGQCNQFWWKIGRVTK